MAPFLVLFLHQDKSTPEDQSSWDSFKTMTPELSIVPGEQKDRMELHNKNWDSSSANTPDSSEGDFQTEVWRYADLYTLTWKHMLMPRYRCTQRYWTPEKLYITTWFFGKDTLLPVTWNVLCLISHCICLLLQWTDMERRLFYSIFSQRLLKRKNRGLTHLWLKKVFKWT